MADPDAASLSPYQRRIARAHALKAALYAQSLSNSSGVKLSAIVASTRRPPSSSSYSYSYSEQDDTTSLPSSRAPRLQQLQIRRPFPCVVFLHHQLLADIWCAACQSYVCFVCAQQCSDQRHGLFGGSFSLRSGCISCTDLRAVTQAPTAQVNRSPSLVLQHFNFGCECMLDIQDLRCPCGKLFQANPDSRICCMCCTAVCSEACHIRFCEAEPEPLCRYKYAYVPEVQDKIHGCLCVTWGVMCTAPPSCLLTRVTGSRFLELERGGDKDSCIMRRGYLQMGNPHASTLACMKVVDGDVRKGRNAWRICLCDCTSCHPATMSTADMPVPRPDGCGDASEGGDDEGQELHDGGGVEAGVRLPSASHRVQAPGSLTPAYMSNRLGSRLQLLQTGTASMIRNDPITESLVTRLEVHGQPLPHACRFCSCADDTCIALRATLAMDTSMLPATHTLFKEQPPQSRLRKNWKIEVGKIRSVYDDEDLQAAADAEAANAKRLQAEAAAAAEAERRRLAAAMHAAAQAPAAADPKTSKLKFSFFGKKSGDAKEDAGKEAEEAAGDKKKGFFSGMFGRK